MYLNGNMQIGHRRPYRCKKIAWFAINGFEIVWQLHPRLAVCIQLYNTTVSVIGCGTFSAEVV
jgi:hypothetical protein